MNASDQPTPGSKRVAVGLILFGWVVAVIAVFQLLPYLLLSAYDGESFDWLNRKIASHAALAEVEGLPTRDRQWYADSAARYSYRMAMFATLGAVVALLAVYRRRVARQIHSYVTTPGYALNLGVIRAVTFLMVMKELTTLPILKIAELPNELYRWPALARWALAPVPIEPWYVEIALPIAITTCVLAIIGLGSRWTALITAVLAYTLVGIPGLSGKVNHSHHVLVFAFLIALTRCGDRFSLDAIIRSLRAKTVARPDAKPLFAYGFPIRLLTIILATVYFFPGFWKAGVGPEWVFGDAMVNITRNIWFQRETFEPLMRVDLLGPLGIFGALGTIAFEMGFLPAVFFRWPRALFAIIGTVFHIMVRQTMGIAFVSLQVMYVVFIDFQTVLAWLGERFGPSKLTIYYDGHCGLCKRTINVLLELDWLQRLHPQNALELTETDPIHAYAEPSDLVESMHALSQAPDAKPRDGYAAYQQIAWRVPLLWPLAAIMWLPPIAMIGRTIYRCVADSRACKVDSSPASSPPGATRATWSPIPLTAVFILTFVGFLGTGFTKMVVAWPVACYPTFDSPGATYTDWPVFLATTESGRQIELDDDPLRAYYGGARYVQVLRRFVARGDERSKLIALLGELAVIWEDTGYLDPDDPPQSIEVAVSRYELIGPKRPEEPLSSESRLTADWSEITGVSKSPATP